MFYVKRVRIEMKIIQMQCSALGSEPSDGDSLVRYMSVRFGEKSLSGNTVGGYEWVAVALSRALC